MKEFLDTELLQSNWFFYGVLLIVGIPILIIIFNEILYRNDSKKNAFVAPIRLFRNIILPLIAVTIIFTKVIGYSSETTSVKIILTIIYILLINGILAIINTLFFSRSADGKAKSKIPQLFLDIFRVLLVGLGAAIVLSVVWGADLGGMITALGLGSFVIGLALQDTLGNLFSGIALIYERPFSVGDTIKVQGIIGRVLEMNWRAVRLITRKNELIIIPHLIIGQSTVENMSKPSKTNIVTQSIGFSYDIPPNKVKEVLRTAAEEVPGILKSPEPHIYTSEYGDSSITYEIEYAIPDFPEMIKTNDDLLTRLWYISQRENLDMPYPHLNVIMDKDKSLPNTNYEAELENKINRIADLLPITKSIIPNIKNKITHLKYGKGEIILQQGDVTGILGLVISGTAELCIINKHEEDKILRVAQKDDFFGQISTLSNKKLSYTVVAVEDIEILKISEEAVREIIDKHPSVVYYLGETKNTKTISENFKFINNN